MLSYLQNLPQASPAARRRFVILATAVSFVVILAVWAGVVRLARRATAPVAVPSASPVEALPVPAPLAAPPPAPSVSAGASGSLLEALQQPAEPAVDVDQVAASLLGLFGEGR